MTELRNPTTATPADGAPLEGERLVAVYARWRVLARRFIKGERAGVTLGATDLANSVFLNLRSVRFRDTYHAFAVGARSMRRLLVSHARQRMSVKRGAGATHVPIVAESGSEASVRGALPMSASETYLGALIDLDDALRDLGRLSERLHRVVELRYFGGYSIEEVAAAMGRSEPSVKRDWVRARAFLLARLAEPRDER